MKDTIQYADFEKLDLRVGTITQAERVPETDKLVKLTVDFGEAVERTIVAGIAQHFDVSLLAGVQVCAVLNLAPRKMRGIESNGMILAAHTATGLALVQCPGAPDGAELG